MNALATLESPIDILDLVGEYEEIPSPQFPVVEVLEESNAMADPGHIADVNTTDQSLPLEEEDEDVDAPTKATSNLTGLRNIVQEGMF